MKNRIKHYAKQYDYLLPWIVWLTAALFYAYEYCLQIAPSIMVSELIRGFHINAAKLGNLAAFYFYAYTLMQMPSGIILDRFGPRRSLSLAAMVVALGSLLFASSAELHVAQLGRFLIGLGSSFAVVGAFKLAANWFPISRFALLTGLTLTLGMTGAFIAGAPLATLVNTLGWHNTMFLLTALGVIIALLLWLIVRDHPPTNDAAKKRVTPEKKLAQLSIIDSLRLIIGKKQNWLVAAYGSLMFAPTLAFASLWGVPFLMSAYHMSRPLAGGAISMAFVGWAIGSPCLGFISDIIKRRLPTMIIAPIGAFITLTCVIYIKIPVIVLYSLLFLFGFTSSGFLSSFSIIREINPNEISATVLSFMNTINMLGGAILQPLIGLFLDQKWSGKGAHAQHLFSVHDFHVALLIVPVILAIAMLLLPFIQETHCHMATPTDNSLLLGNPNPKLDG